MQEAAVPVRVTLDREVNAAYIYLADEPAFGWRHGKIVPIDVDQIPCMVLAAASLLPDKILTALDRAND